MVGGNPGCLVDLSFKAALKASNDGHGEGVRLTNCGQTGNVSTKASPFSHS